MVNWLGELLYLSQGKELLLKKFAIENLDETSLKAAVTGEKFHPEDRADESQRDVEHDLGGEGHAAELHVEDEQHGDQAEGTENKNETRRTRLALELSAVGHEVSLGKDNFVRHGLLRIAHRGNQIAPRRIEHFR